MRHDPKGPYLSIANRALALGPIDAQTRAVLAILRRHVELVALLGLLRELKLPAAYVGGGAIPQIVWNDFHGFDRNHGLSDFDVVYFDSEDLSREAEQHLEATLNARLSGCPVHIEAINEARVHLWYERDFGKAMEPYRCTEDAIYCFPTTASATAVSMDPDGEWRLVAPHGLTDLLGLVVRPNKIQISEQRYLEKCERWRQLWPGLTVVPWARHPQRHRYARRAARL